MVKSAGSSLVGHSSGFSLEAFCEVGRGGGRFRAKIHHRFIRFNYYLAEKYISYLSVFIAGTSPLFRPAATANAHASPWWNARRRGV
jgi:hypothetical protein